MNIYAPMNDVDDAQNSKSQVIMMNRKIIKAQRTHLYILIGELCVEIILYWGYKYDEIDDVDVKSESKNRKSFVIIMFFFLDVNFMFKLLIELIFSLSFSLTHSLANVCNRILAH
jgi:hypothetical protein